MKKKIGIIGCGAMGSQIAEYISANLRDISEVAFLSDIDDGKAKELSGKIKPAPRVTTIDELINKADLIIEAASPAVSGDVAEKADSLKKDALIMSTGGLLKKEGIIEKIKAGSSGIHIPSGAICGLDGLKSAMAGTVTSVTLITRKPLKGLAGSPYLKEKNIDIEKIDRETLLYSGTAREAIKYFPQNINVAVTLSIYGLGADLTHVKIFTSPEYTKNIHEVEVIGEFGRLWTKTENVPSRANPKTSGLAIFSAIAKLKEIV
ncbi:MAG: aspartate dehydrogenase domain-containing protein [Candidatus Omnitrophota bacterium]|jgi:aspartate dehydrogenase